MPHQGVSVYLSRDLHAQVQRLAKQQRRSESSFIAQALKTHLNAGAAGQTAEENAQRKLSRLDARIDKVLGETLLVKETLLLFIRVWLEHVPPLPEAEEESAAASAEARFERFLDMVAQALAPGQSIAAQTFVGAPPADSGNMNGEAS